MKKLKQSKAITLIALIITIIILLILAGVTIVTLTGENGILNHAQGTKTKSEIADIEEKIKLAVMTSKMNINNSARIDITILQDELEKSLGEDVVIEKTGENGALPWNVIKNGKKFLVSEDGNVSLQAGETETQVSNVTSITVEDMEIGKGSSAQLKVTTTPENNVEELIYTSSDETIATVDNTGKVTIAEDATVGSTVTITVAGKESTNVTGTCTITVAKQTVNVTPEQIAANPKTYYGKQVVNYKASDSDTNVYRIFYVDTDNYFGDGANNVYLKADYSGSITCSTTYDAEATKVKQMNPLWADERGESTWNDNEKVSAWLCDPTKWTTYYNENYANYAIGGPSIEMYVKSYNQAFKDTNEYVLGASYRATNAPGYIYTLNGAQSTISNSDYYTGTDSLNYTEYSSMYAGKNGSKTGNWWLASPSSNGSNIVCYVRGYSALLYYDHYGNAYRGSPLVSLRSDFTIQIEQ